MTAPQDPYATVRLNCQQCQVCLYAGEEMPEEGLEGVATAAGCYTDPPSCPGYATRVQPPAPDAPVVTSTLSTLQSTGVPGATIPGRRSAVITEDAARRIDAQRLRLR